MDGYGPSSYGDAFADVYDEWYADADRPEVVDTVVTMLTDLAAERGPGRDPVPGPGPRLLELGVGTGRLAVPLARAGFDVTGLDASSEMLARLARRDAGGIVRAVHGDMVDDLPAGPFDVVLVAINTLFNLDSRARQGACVAAVADRLGPHGRFVVEAFVPDPPDPPDSDTAGPGGAGDPAPRIDLTVRSMTADGVVLAAWRHLAAEQRAEGQLIELRDGQPVRVRPISVRYSTPDELDAMAAEAGLALIARYGGFDRSPFDPGHRQHVSVYGPMRRASDHEALG